MKKWQIEFVRWTNFLLEVTSLFIFIMTAFLAVGSFPPALSYVLTIIFGSGIFIVLQKTFKSNIITLFSVPLLLIFNLVIGWHWFFAIILSVILFWRLFVLADDYYPEYAMYLSIFTVMVGVFMYGFHTNTVHNSSAILIIVILHITGTSFVNMTNSLFSSDGNEKNKDFTKIVIFHTVIALVTINGKLLFPILTKILRFFAELIAQLAGRTGKPLIELFPEVPDEYVPQDGERFDIDYSEQFATPKPTPLDPNTFLILIIVLIVILIINALLKKKRLQKVNDYVELDENESIVIEKIPKNYERKKRFKVVNPVRRSLLGLEKSLAKTGFGRRYDQTIEDWLSTLQTDVIAKEIVIQKYEKVRYGDMELSKEELSAYKKAIALLKKSIK